MQQLGTMTALSPYAPPRRNSFLEHQPKQKRRSSKPAAVGLLLLVLKFWSRLIDDERLPAALRVSLRAMRRRIQELPASVKPFAVLMLEWLQVKTGIALQRLKGPLTAPVIVSDEEESLPELVVVDVGVQVGRTTSENDEQANDQLVARVEAGVQVDSRSIDGRRPEALEASRGDGRVRDNVARIHDVLQYWFGQYTIDESQKKLWMIANEESRHRVDGEITDRFASLLQELANGELWNEWVGDDVYGYGGKVAAIVVLDQFSRHMHRYSAETMCRLDLPQQVELDERAFSSAVRYLAEHKTEMRSGLIPPPFHIFALMPLRHRSTIEQVSKVQANIAEMDKVLEEYGIMHRRFRSATNRRMAVLQDESRRTGGGSDRNYEDDDILEHHGFVACMSSSRIHVVHQTICSFLADQGIHPSSANDDTPTKKVAVVVSLSGGVDSMVIASVLAYLVESCHYYLHLLAVHIDYANRPESSAEAAFCRNFCQRLGISFQCRRIDEITRGVAARDEYETMSRQVRYEEYRKAVEEGKRKTTLLGAKSRRDKIGVMLGHHRGDLRENVLSNAHKGSGPLDLSGMTAVSENDGVTLFRPLLPLEKTAIFDYAHKFGVPYFKDTTPHWSTRGKLRNKLLPLLEEIYGEGSMNNLSNLAVESDECRDLVQRIALRPFLDQVVYKPMGISFDTAPWKNQGAFFWKFVLREALHSAGLGMWTDKSALTFLERVQAKDVREGWLQCRKDYGVYLQEDGRAFVFYPRSFPWRDADNYRCQGQKLHYGPENSTLLGPWRVTVRRQLYGVFEPKEVQEHLDKKAVADMMQFLDGSIDYYLEARTFQTPDGSFEPRPLVFTQFTKLTRPRAWKNVDLKIQQKLPLAGNDASALAALKDPLGSCATHVNSEGQVVENPILLVKVSLRLASVYPPSPERSIH